MIENYPSYTPPGLSAIQESDGRWRWTYTAPTRGTHISPTSYPTRFSALSGGRAWVAVRSKASDLR